MFCTAQLHCIKHETGSAPLSLHVERQTTSWPGHECSITQIKCNYFIIFGKPLFLNQCVEQQSASYRPECSRFTRSELPDSCTALTATSLYTRRARPPSDRAHPGHKPTWPKILSMWKYEKQSRLILTEIKLPLSGQFIVFHQRYYK